MHPLLVSYCRAGSHVQGTRGERTGPPALRGRLAEGPQTGSTPAVCNNYSSLERGDNVCLARFLRQA